MSAHKEAAKQRKRKSLKMALEKCMQRRDAMASAEAVPDTGAGETGGVTGGESTAAVAAAAAANLLSFEQQQQQVHQELALQIKAAMAAEQEQREAEAEAEAMDTTANTTTTMGETSTTTATTTATSTATTTTITTDGSDAEASDLSGSEINNPKRTATPTSGMMDIDEPMRSPDPESELVVVEPKIEPLSDSEEDEEQHYAPMMPLDANDDEPPVDDEMHTPRPHTPTSQMLMPHEAPTLTSTPKVNVDVSEQ
ncbi:hypothetical protein ACLKA7_002968 [Drosophila subpalustris]